MQSVFSNSMAAISCFTTVIMTNYTRKQIKQNTINDEILQKISHMDDRLYTVSQ